MDRYQLGEAIGKGGFATVYRALDTERGDFVAIKLRKKGRVALHVLTVFPFLPKIGYVLVPLARKIFLLPSSLTQITTTTTTTTISFL